MRVTKKQYRANRIDMEVYNVVVLLEDFAKNYDLRDVDEMARVLDGLRWRVRIHMSNEDRERTK